MIHWSIEEQMQLYELFLCAINSDNTDYIKEKLQEIYNIICEKNFG